MEICQPKLLCKPIKKFYLYYRDFEALERERQQRKEERRRLRREIEERSRKKDKGWGSEWEREEAR